MERRNFLRAAVLGGAAVAFGGASWRDAFAEGAQPGPSPYGPLQPVNATGLRLPAGFTSRVVARSSQLVAGTSDRWHPAPDGGACFADGSGWIYVSNSEVFATGGVSAIRFSSTGAVTGAYRTLSNTNLNCAGGATSGPVTWLRVPDPDGSPTPTRLQGAAAKHFDGGEGCHYANGTCWFTTKGDNRGWAFDAEDGGTMDICVITPGGVVAPFLRIPGSRARRPPVRRSARPATACTSRRSAARRAPTRAASPTK